MAATLKRLNTYLGMLQNERIVLWLRVVRPCVHIHMANANSRHQLKTNPRNEGFYWLILSNISFNITQQHAIAFVDSAVITFYL